MVQLLRLLGRGARAVRRRRGAGRPAGSRLSLPTLLAVAGRQTTLAEAGAPLALDALVPGAVPWELELGFGKGRYLLRRALEEPAGRFLGIEIATKYWRLLAGRAARRGAMNLVAVRGEALYLLASALPSHFAAAVHVYHPDPWPKSRHHKRRLFDPETVDLVIGALAPGGRLYFGTDYLDYGESVAEILTAYPGLTVECLPAWPGGPRTNYEAKYVEEGRPILRLIATLDEAPDRPALHPGGEGGVVLGPRSEPGAHPDTRR